jgi:hypothetical protein
MINKNIGVMLMKNLCNRLKDWIHTILKYNPNCNIYFKNEKIFSCGNCNQAEQHIKRMFQTVSGISTETSSHKETILHPEETTCWKKFRSNFKISNE